MQLFDFIPAKGPLAPILVSVPHAGTFFPPEVREQYDQELIKAPDDTDWFVDQLYDFAPAMGITMIVAKVSRWVIDLNRDPDSKPLYGDGRIITNLVPETTFLGQPLYKNDTPDSSEIELRLDTYYRPYHQRIEEELAKLKKGFQKVLLFDAHSIRQVVKSIHTDPFPDLILGDNDGKSAHPELIDAAMTNLGNKGYQLQHNMPFKGGHITRSFGNPQDNVHALQLEMTKINYMDDAEVLYHPRRADLMRQVLIPTFQSLIDTLSQI